MNAALNTAHVLRQQQLLSQQMSERQERKAPTLFTAPDAFEHRRVPLFVEYLKRPAFIEGSNDSKERTELLPVWRALHNVQYIYSKRQSTSYVDTIHSACIDRLWPHDDDGDDDNDDDDRVNNTSLHLPALPLPFQANDDREIEKKRIERKRQGDGRLIKQT